tara:strand:+ start:2271 stop:2966 length:696 start_codon:yes stop_codon:yes gene_type:complete
MKYKEKNLIVAAHPDDEVLGCGGYLSKYKNKKNFKIIFIGEGTSCRYKKNENEKLIKKEILKREKESISCLKYLGIKNYVYYNFPCGRLDSIDILEINKIIEKEIQIFKPNKILTHSYNDCNNDHRIINRSVMMATRPVPKNKFLKCLMTFEVISSSEWNFESQFNPNYFENLSEKNIIEKINAFYFYKSEIQTNQMPRTKDGIKTLAKYRGKIISSKYAEAYKIIRNIVE